MTPDQQTQADSSRSPLRRPVVWVLSGLILAVLVWSYGPYMRGLPRSWWNDPDYTYGFFVPIFSAYLLWCRREMINRITFDGSWWGLVLIAVAAGIRGVAGWWLLDSFHAVSIVPCLAGIVLVVGGWPALRWSWSAIFFLSFMFPLRGFFVDMFSHPLQRIGAVVSTLVIQVFGIPSVARGNIIVLPNTELGVAEACNGLPMMMLFMAVCFGAVFLSDRSSPEKLLILASAAPIAVLANVIRIAATAILYQLGSAELGEKLFHDVAGWFMMPIAVILLWTLLWFLDHALIMPQDKKPVVIKP